jgi:hypothetical protein
MEFSTDILSLTGLGNIGQHLHPPTKTTRFQPHPNPEKIGQTK